MTSGITFQDTASQRMNVTSVIRKSSDMFFVKLYLLLRFSKVLMCLYCEARMCTGCEYSQATKTAACTKIWNFSANISSHKVTKERNYIEGTWKECKKWRQNAEKGYSFYNLNEFFPALSFFCRIWYSPVSCMWSCQPVINSSRVNNVLDEASVCVCMYLCACMYGRNYHLQSLYMYISC